MVSYCDIVEDRYIYYRKRIAMVVYGHETMMLDTGFGLSLYLVSPDAFRDGSVTRGATIIGASWQKARDSNGNVAEFYCRMCPVWHKNLIDAWRLIEFCNRVDSGVSWKILKKHLDQCVLFGYSPEDAASHIVYAVICTLDEMGI